MLILMLMSALNLEAQNINKPNKLGPLGTQVNTFSGNFFLPRNDITIPARGLDLTITFYYNSFNFEEEYGFGKGWNLGYNIRYRNDSLNNKTISWGEGREDIYTVLPGGTYKTPKGFYSVLTEYQPNKYRLQDKDGARYYFDNNIHRKITRAEEPNGNFLNFNYTDSLLSLVTNAAGQSISFTYNSNGRLSSVVDAIASPSRTYTYSYDGSGCLTQVTDPLAGTNKYTYLVNGPMKTLADKNNNIVDIIYYNDFSVSEIIGCNKRVSFSYDTVSNTTVVTDHLTAGNNQVTKYTYQTSDNHAWLTNLSSNCCGYNMSFDFDQNGNKIEETDANGNKTSFTYSANGNILTIKDALNQLSSYTYSADFSNITSFTDPKGNLYTLTYDSKGNLLQLIEPGNIVSTATYNANGDIATNTDPKGNTFTYTYDSYGNLMSITGPDGFQASLNFDSRGNLLSVTDANGRTSNAEYDILNRIKKIIDPLNNSVEASYDAQGNPVSIKNKKGYNTLLGYDASNRLVQLTDPVSNKNYVSYDAMDNITSIKNALGNTLSYSYDSRNKLTGIKNPLNNTTTINYDAKGNITSATLPNGQQLSYSYDNLNRLISVSDASGVVKTLSYDANNNITGYTNGTGALTTASYDSRDRLSKITDPLGNSELYTYDKNDNITAVTDRNGFTKSYTYDGMNRIKSMTDNNGFTINLTRDAGGNITSVKDQNNNITSYAYDNMNRLTKTTYPDGKFLEQSYDNKGNVISKKLTDGTSITFQYDSLNRVIGKTLPNGHQFTYAYDAVGKVVSASNADGTINISYDALNRITAESSAGKTTRYSYNISGRTQSTIYPDSTTITKTFDTRNRLISISKNNTTIASYQYNNANQVITKSFGNGITTNLQYDFANRLSNFITANGSIQNTSFTYDNVGNKKTINRTNDPALSEQFTYDNGYRITNYKRGIIGGATTIQNSYNFDAVGNRLTANLNGSNTNYTVNNLNQITNSNNGSQNINFLYDNNGNLIYDGFYHKSYDAESRLIKDSASASNVITYEYDAFGRKLKKYVNGFPIRYTYSGLAAIEERDGITDNILTRTLFSNFLTPVVNEKSNVSYYYHQNELNSVEAITNPSGNLTERYQYDLYGKPSIYNSSNSLITSSIAGNRFGFTGQIYDSATSTYQFVYRSYSPSTGTFNQRDLIGYGDAMGLYQYVHNNPANGIDLLGLQPCPPEPGLVDITKSDMATHAGNMLSLLSMIKRLEESNKFKGTSLMVSINNLDVAITKYINEGSKMSEKDRNIMLADIEFNATTLAADLTPTTPATAGPKAVIGTLGKIDAATQEITSYLGGGGPGMSLNAIYAHQSDAAEAVGRDAANEINDSYYRREQTIINYTREHGSDISTWSPRMRLIYKLQQNFKKYRIEKPVQQPVPNPDDCPQNTDPGGTQKNKPKNNGTPGSTTINQSWDPNEMVGPEGEPDKRWVSVKDRLPYTILYENDKSASAPAKYVKITTAIEPKQDAATFQLGTFGFNNLTFSVPNNTASYYQRVDCKDSLGLYIDVTAGYDQVSNQAFWEFQSIDPLTLLPPSHPFSGFLLLQDSSKPMNGHGFVNFSIKPLQSSVTRDTIGAKAAIVFDLNAVIPTNIAMNTIDAFAPTSHMNSLPSTSNNPIALSWGGVDDAGGCGLKYYTLYVSTDGTNFNILRSNITRTDTTFTGSPNTMYYFFVLATDTVGNTEQLRPGEVRSTYVGAILPVSWLYFRGNTQDKNNILEWATATEQNNKEFRLERSIDGSTFTQIANVPAAGNSNSIKTYQHTDRNIDRLNSSVMFYRLKQVDKDNNFKYSNIVRLHYNENVIPKSIVYPNPTQNMVTITIGDSKLVGTNAILYDQAGQLLETIKIKSNNQQLNLVKYVNGVYYVRLNNKEVLTIIKN